MVFRTWLSGEMERQGVSRRELARRLSAGNPERFSSYRRQVTRWLDPDSPVSPRNETRQAIAVALGANADDVPSEEDEESDLLAQLAPLTRSMRSLEERLASRIERVESKLDEALS
jgi:hypothetical protein